MNTDTQHPTPADSQWKCCACALMLPTLRRALGIQVLLIAALGMLSASAGWRVAGGVFLGGATGGESTVSDAKFLGQWPGNRTVASTPWHRALPETLATRTLTAPADPVLTPVYHFSMPMLRLLDRGVSWSGWFYFLTGEIWAILSWGFFGTMICRLSVLETAGIGNADIAETFQFAREKFHAVAAAALLPLAGIAVAAIPLVLLGLIMRLDIIGTFVGGLLWVLVLALGIVMAVLLFGFLLGWPLMWSAIAAEGSDAFDAVSRALAYAYQRPLRYFGYLLLAAGLGLVGWVSVWVFSEAAIQLGYWGVSWGAGGIRVTDVEAAARGDGPGVGWGGPIIGCWVGLARTMASAYAYSFCWCAVSVVYMLLRFDVDSKEWDEVYAGMGNTTYGLTSAKENGH